MLETRTDGPLGGLNQKNIFALDARDVGSHQDVRVSLLSPSETSIEVFVTFVPHVYGKPVASDRAEKSASRKKLLGRCFPDTAYKTTGPAWRHEKRPVVPKHGGESRDTGRGKTGMDTLGGGEGGVMPFKRLGTDAARLDSGNVLGVASPRRAFSKTHPRSENAHTYTQVDTHGALRTTPTSTSLHGSSATSAPTTGCQIQARVFTGVATKLGTNRQESQIYRRFNILRMEAGPSRATPLMVELPVVSFFHGKSVNNTEKCSPLGTFTHPLHLSSSVSVILAGLPPTTYSHRKRHGNIAVIDPVALFALLAVKRGASERILQRHHACKTVVMTRH